ncbi:hypothetical protein MKEN_00300400 [Mycena kentingensis (nom. inval.)]|nr:hypothetical protein MKEN_00300400 [Mycena kentingensis (nom. inval.)]
MKCPGTAAIPTHGPYVPDEETWETYLSIKFTLKPRPADVAPRYVALSDILNFRHATELSDYARKQVRQVETTGTPVTVEYFVCGPGDTHDEVLCIGTDVLYLNCSHRKITKYELAYYLAWGHRHLIRSKLGQYNYMWRDFELVYFLSCDGKEFSSVCRMKAKASRTRT